jgi:hypothetical protein
LALKGFSIDEIYLIIMQENKKNKDDFDLGSFSKNDSDFNDLFSDFEKTPDPMEIETPVKNPKNDLINDLSFEAAEVQPKKKKRTISDFEPDMDALLITAQSSMIIDGMEFYKSRQFTPNALQVYMEALKGVDLYITILNRSPNNYRKLKELIDSDSDCQQVEKIAFDLYKQEHRNPPETDKEKLESFYLYRQIFRQCLDKTNISKSMRILKKYYLISGGLDFEKIQTEIDRKNPEFREDVKDFHKNLKTALDLLKRGSGEIAKGLKGRDLNVYITKTSELLGYFYKAINNPKISDYYFRIYKIYSKYFIIKE